MTDYEDQLSAIHHEMKEPEAEVGMAIRGAFAALDELIALAAQPKTRPHVINEKVMLGQLLTRCQTLASFSLTGNPSPFRMIRNG